jgi:hypothetical protein
VRQADSPPVRAAVQNLSARGLALVVALWIEVGVVVPVRLFNEGATYSLDARLRVTRACSGPRGVYLIAGELDRVLEPEELLPFLV